MHIIGSNVYGFKLVHRLIEIISLVWRCPLGAGSQWVTLACVVLLSSVVVHLGIYKEDKGNVEWGFLGVRVPIQYSSYNKQECNILNLTGWKWKVVGSIACQQNITGKCLPFIKWCHKVVWSEVLWADTGHQTALITLSVTIWFMAVYARHKI